MRKITPPISIGVLTFQITAALLFIDMICQPAYASPCGGEGQRACCLFERASGRDCDEHFVQVPGCSGDCLCSGVGPVKSSGTCVRLTECGAKGQRACCIGERPGKSCNADLYEISGCEGGSTQCRCNNGIADSSGTCCQRETVSAEPLRQACAARCYESSNCYHPAIEVQALCQQCLSYCQSIPDSYSFECGATDGQPSRVRVPQSMVKEFEKARVRKPFPLPKKGSKSGSGPGK